MFNPYREWLGIPDNQIPPNCYRLLGIELYESDLNVISAAADRVMMYVRTYQSGPHSAESQRLLNEISAARICLLNLEKKTSYDNQLRQQLAQTSDRPPHNPPIADSRAKTPVFNIGIGINSTFDKRKRKDKPWLPSLIASVVVIALVAIGGGAVYYCFLNDSVLTADKTDDELPSSFQPQKQINTPVNNSNNNSASTGASSPLLTGNASDGNVSDGNVSDGNVSDGNASDGNASDGNVSDGNVSDGNVSDGNASDGNASDGNRTAGARASVASAAAKVQENVRFEKLNVSLQSEQRLNQYLKNRFLAIAYESGVVAVLEPGTGRVVFKQQVGAIKLIRRLAWSPDGRYLAAGGKEPTVHLWDMTNQQMIQEFNGHASQVNDLCFSPNGNQLLTSSLDGVICIWNWRTGDLAQSFSGLGQIWTSVFSPDGKKIAFAGVNDFVSLIDAATGETYLKKRCPGQVQRVAYSPNGRLIMVVNNNSPLHFLDVNTGDWCAEVNHSGETKAGEFSADGNFFVCVGSRDAFIVGNGTNPAGEFSEPNLGSRMNDACWISRDGSYIILGDDTGQIKIVDRKENAIVRSFRVLQNRCWDLSLNEPR